MQRLTSIAQIPSTYVNCRCNIPRAVQWKVPNSRPLTAASRNRCLEQPTAAVVSDRTLPEVPMKPKCLMLVAGITAALSCSAFGQQDEKLGKLSFPTACDPKLQAEFERGVAMIHSYWFLIARRTFEGVLRQDPACAMAYWGIALDLLNNSLAVVPPRADAEAAWAALEKAREIGAKAQRERDWIESLSASASFCALHKGFRPDDRDSLKNRRKPAIQLDEEQAIAVREL